MRTFEEFSYSVLFPLLFGTIIISLDYNFYGIHTGIFGVILVGIGTYKMLSV
jgi:hypothetical protein